MAIELLDFPGTAARVRLDRTERRLVGSVCSHCGAASWPARAVCYRCHAAPMTIKAFARTGTVVSYTTVWISRPGVPAPFVLGQVRLDDGPLVVAHIREIGEGRTVPFDAILVAADDTDAIPPFWFVPRLDRQPVA